MTEDREKAPGKAESAASLNPAKEAKEPRNDAMRQLMRDDLLRLLTPEEISRIQKQVGTLGTSEVEEMRFGEAATQTLKSDKPKSEEG